MHVYKTTKSSPSQSQSHSWSLESTITITTATTSPTTLHTRQDKNDDDDDNDDDNDNDNYYASTKIVVAEAKSTDENKPGTKVTVRMILCGHLPIRTCSGINITGTC
jgi:hypothetical protein